jgi:hypothetical protein
MLFASHLRAGTGAVAVLGDCEMLLKDVRVQALQAIGNDCERFLTTAKGGSV